MTNSKISLKEAYDNRDVIAQIVDLRTEAGEATDASANAVATSNHAATLAGNAVDTANAASAVANGIDAKATQALEKSAEAVTASHKAEGTADAASAVADAAAATANSIDGKAQNALDATVRMDGRVKECVTHISTSATVDGVSIGYATDGKPSPQVRVDIPVLDGMNAGVMTPAQMQEVTDQLDTLGRDLNNVKAEYLDKFNPQEVQDITGNVNFMRSPTVPTLKSREYASDASMRVMNVESMAFLASRTMVFRQGTNNTSLIKNAYVIGTMACDGLKGMPTVEIGSAMYIAIGAFQSSDVEVVIAPKQNIIVESYAFVNAKKLRRVDYYPASVEGATFNNTVIDTLIIRTPEVVPLRYPDTFTNTPIGNGTGYVYVPDELVDQYKQATNWVAISNQIKGLSMIPMEASS